MRFFIRHTAMAAIHDNNEELLCVGAIAVCPVFRNPSLSLTQMTKPVFFSFIYIVSSSSFQLSLCWLAELEAPGG